MVFRIAMFCLVGAFVLWMQSAMGAPSQTRPWLFVSAGLGAVAAIELRAWWRRHRQLHGRAPRAGRGPP